MFNYNTAIFNSVELHGIFSPEETVQRNYQNLQSFKYNNNYLKLTEIKDTQRKHYLNFPRKKVSTYLLSLNSFNYTKHFTLTKIN